MTSADTEEMRELVPTEEARAVLWAFDRDLETLLARDAPLGDMADWAGKAVGAAVRVAGLLHVAEHPDREDPTLIQADTVARAVQIMRYLLAHARAALDLASEPPRNARARWALETIVRKGMHTFRVRDLFAAASRSRFPDVESLRDALRVLEEHGYIAQRPNPSPGNVGRPASTTYHVHPSAFAHNTKNDNDRGNPR